ncbi:protein telomere ends associated-like [Drosophila ficusphila]|uniref:protein telomere ends associated-like n=1 Tax=Drosophila ficusphila TaxID=30025 RepID=UPI0007E7BADF|nr:protein telomere ends associated-like [Drosophila ficusphila]
MSELKAKSPLSERSLNNSASRDQIYPVTFKIFKRLIANLPQITTALRSSDENHKTDDEWARWYYEAFYRDPSIREKYQFEVAPCPGGVREKLLKVPDLELIRDLQEPISEQMVVADAAKTDSVNAKSESDNLQGNQNLRSGDEIVEVDKYGTFIFPVSFQTFERSLNQIEVFRQVMKSQDDCLKLLVDDGLRNITLKKFYNSYYMRPQHRGKENIFQEFPPTPLAKLLEIGRPYDDTAVKTALKFAAENSDNNNSIVSFEQFKRSLRNLRDIVEDLKQMDKNYDGKDFEECAYDYYKAFYLTPEIRHKVQFQLRPCAAEFQDRLLAFPSKETANAQLTSHSPKNNQTLISRERESLQRKEEPLNSVSKKFEVLSVDSFERVSIFIVISYHK